MNNTMNRMVWIPAALGLAILAILSTGMVAASPQLPCEFYGTVSINGADAPAGTVITAYVNSVEQGKIVVKEPGKYGGTGTFDERLIVLSGENDFSGGTPVITFRIGETVADQDAEYAPGMSSELALTTGGHVASAAQAATAPAPEPVAAAAVPAVPTPPVPQEAVVSSEPAAPAPVQAASAAPAPQPAVTAAPVPANQTVPQNVTPPVVVAATPAPADTNQTAGNATANVTPSPAAEIPVTVSFPSGQTASA